jgi:hypothetical protein
LEFRKGASFAEALTYGFGPDPLELEAAEMKERHARERLALIEVRLTAEPPADINPTPERFTGIVISPSAARKLETFIRSKGMGFTEFANQAGTTDRTIRSFRKTGKVRRDIFHGIAKAIGLKPEDLIG